MAAPQGRNSLRVLHKARRGRQRLRREIIDAMSPQAHEIDSPSPWVRRWAPLIRPGGRVLDVACGHGRHLRYLSSLGFAVVVVTHYLHRPLFADLVGALRPGGVLIYETFALGNERYGRPSNAAFLLRPDELLHRVEPLAVVAFEQGLVSAPKQAVIQRVCAVRAGTGAAPLDAARLR